MLNIATQQGEVISPGQFLTLKKKGMPFYKNSMDYGDLHIRFTVEFPKPGQIKPDALQKLIEVLNNYQI
jgi:DnaJ homolog subfamily A member 2